MAISLSQLRIEATMDAAGYVSGANQKTASDAKMVASGNQLAGSLTQVGTAVEQTDRKLGTSTTAVERLKGKYIEGYQATAQFQKALADLNRFQDQGKITSSEYEKALAGIHARYQQVPQSANAAAVSTGQMQFAVRDLGFQLNDLATQMASGGGIFRPLIQQAGQIQGAFQAGGGVSATLGAFATSIRSMITPTTLAVAGVAALAGGIVFLALRSSETEARLRSFDVILHGLGMSSNVTAGGLDQVVRRLRDTGTAADEALKAVQAFARVPGINPASAATLVPLSRDIGAATGQDLSSVTAQLAKSFAQGTDAAAKFVQEIAGPNGLTVAELANMKAMAAHGDRAGALNIAIGALQRQFGGSFDKSLSDSAKAINSIGAAWDDMAKKLENTSFVKNIHDFMIQQMKEIGDAVRAVPAPPSVDWRAERNAIIQRNNPQAQGYGFTPNYSSGFSLPAAAGVNVAGLNDEFSRRLSAWFNDLSDSDRALVSIISGARSVEQQTAIFARGGIAAAPGGSAHNFGVGADIVGMSATARSMLGLYGLHAPVAGDPMHVEPIETPLSTAATAAQRRASFQQFASGMFPNAGQAPTAAPVVPSGLSEKQKSDLQFQIEFNDKVADSARLVGESKVYWQAYFQAIGAGVKDTNAITMAQEAGRAAVESWRAELDKAAQTQGIANDLALKGAEAFGKDEVSGLRAAAQAQAELAVRASDATSVQAKATELLRTGAAEAISAGAKALPGLVQQASASERLAEAAKSGAGAEHEAEVQNQITTATHEALTKAIATGDPALISQAQKLRDLTEARIRDNDAALQSKAIQDRINERADQLAVVQLQTRMLGTTPEVVQAATASLQEQQRLIAQGVDLSSDKAKNDLASVAALNQANIAYAEGTRQQQRLDDGVRQIASTIDSTLTQSITDAFSGKKVDDWGARIKSMLASLVAQISDALFIKPLLGSLAGALGFGNVAQSLGTFGSIGSIFGGSSGGGGVTVTPNGNGGFSISNLGSVASIANTASGSIFGQSGALGGFGNLFGGSGGGGLFSGVSNFFNTGLGGVFATTNAVPALSTAGIGQMSDLIGIEPSSLGFLGEASSIATPGMFGNLSLGGALGGFGAGFGAGSLLNSLVGGNQTFGMVGSGLGALAGTLLGGPIGGIIGGAAGGLFGGMFGNNKPSNASAGANFDLSNFSLTAGFAGGNQQIDSATQQVAQGLQQFLALLKTTGGALTGNVLLQNGVNTGFTADSSLPGYSGRFNLGKDPTAALNTIELALSKSLTGITDTMKTVLDQTSDPALLAQNIAFANMYDKLSDASADAFKEVENGKDALGPFATAMQQGTTLFQGLTDQAVKFGLAVQPIDAALAEFTSRLQGDFKTALDTALNEATGAGFINQLQGVYDSTIKAIQESQAIGLGTDPATQHQIDQVYQAQLNQILSGLSTTQLDQVIQHFTGLNDAIVILAQSAETATTQTQALADAQQLAAQTAQAQQTIQAYLDQLNATPSASMSPEDALFNASYQFQQELLKAQGGDVNALSDITQYADAYIKDIESFYASSLYGQSLVKEVKDDLQALLGVAGSPQDPAVITNQLLTDQNTKTDAVTTTVAGGTTQTVQTITAGTAQLIDANNSASAAAIAQNSADAATLAGVVNSTAAANIASNDNTTASLIAANSSATAALIAGADTQTALLSQVMTALSNSQVSAVGSSTDALINVGATYSNAIGSAVYGAANEVISTNALYGNNTYVAIGTASASNDNWLAQIASWTQATYQGNTEQQDTMIAQLQDMQNKLQSILDTLRLLSNAPLAA